MIVWPALVLGLLSAAIVVAPDAHMKVALAVPPAATAMICWSVASARRWLILFFLCAILTPPLPLMTDSGGIHLAPLLMIPGAIVSAMRIREWRPAPPEITIAAGLFFVVLVLSAALGTLYLGAQAGLASFTRVGLFGIGLFVLFYASCGPAEPGDDPSKFVRFLFLAGVAAALFGCVDFFFHFTGAGGFADQFVWLDEGVFRRAQGLFYEASTFGNFCTFFLVMIAVGLSRRSDQITVPYLVLIGGGIVLATALMLSYSRGSALNLAAACVALALLRRVRILSVLALALIAALSILALSAIWPSFSASYWSRIAGSLQYFWYSPDGVLSGRIGQWRLLTDFVLQQPWHAVFGIGYKTLPDFGVAGTPLIADNTYLSLLVETGIAGLGTFLALNYCVLKASLRAARDSDRRAVFFGEWIYCFWIGEMVQMLSGDLITYWRVLPVYFWVLGTAVRHTKGAA